MKRNSSLCDASLFYPFRAKIHQKEKLVDFVFFSNFFFFLSDGSNFFLKSDLYQRNNTRSSLRSLGAHIGKKGWVFMKNLVTLMHLWVAFSQLHSQCLLRMESCHTFSLFLTFFFLISISLDVCLRIDLLTWRPKFHNL